MGAATQTIAAIATPPGNGGVGILRLSGPEAITILQRHVGVVPEPRVAGLRPFRDTQGDVIDTGLVVCFTAPNSFTGEHIAEFQGHGGAVLMDHLLELVCRSGARPARPGEFSERAFHHGKLDLAQAEAIADVIAAGSRTAARAATRSLQGEFSTRVNALIQDTVALRVYIEAAMDFPDEDIDFLADGVVADRLRGLQARLAQLRRCAGQGALLQAGLNVAIIGRPNVGKSSLLNQLAGRPSAIVTDIPGTTRDVVREAVQLGALPLHLMDTAGIRETQDPVEQEGVRRAKAALQQADHIFWVIDDTQQHDNLDRDLALLPNRTPTSLLLNKADLSGRPCGVVAGLPHPAYAISALSGAGLDAFADDLAQRVGLDHQGADALSARRRHLLALDNAGQRIASAMQPSKIAHAAELAAEDLRLAHDALGEIVGVMTSDELLGEIFASFCIGK